MSTEAYKLKLTAEDLEKAINEFTPSERRNTADFFIRSIRRVPDLFSKYPGKISEKEAELWITDQETGIRHSVSLSSDNKGVVSYERVDKRGKSLQKLKDQRATETITDVLVDIGVLISVED